VDVGAAVVADEQPLELVQPGEGALQRWRPMPEPCPVLRRAISLVIPRLRSSNRCGLWS
jgi:hypothetical protein